MKRTTTTICCGFLAAVVVGSSPALAQGKIDQRLMQRYGGVLAPDCSNPRHCDPNRNRAPGTAPPVELGPFDLLKDAKFRGPYVRALGPLASEPWLMKLDGPAPPIRKVQVAGNECQLASVCKNHDCWENTRVLLWAPASQAIYGKVVQRGRSTLLGSPPPPVAAELERLWRVEFRKGK